MKDRKEKAFLKTAPIGKKLLHLLPPVLITALFLLALYLLYRQVRNYSIEEIASYFYTLPPSRVILSVLCVIGSYVSLTGYDVLALRYIGHPLGYRSTAFASFTGYAFSNNIGYAPLTGGIIRYRLYSAWGLSAVESAQVVFFITLTSILGFMTVSGISFLFEGTVIPAVLHIGIHSVRPLGIFFCSALAGLLLTTAFVKRPLKIRNFQFSLPSFRLTCMQIIVSSAVWVFSWSSFYLLLPSLKGVSYTGFIQMYVLSQFAGTASQVPGGLGVFEALMIRLMPSEITTSQIAGALISYRTIYYFLPLFSAGLLFLFHELLGKERPAGEKVLHVRDRLQLIALPVLTIFTFLTGTILILSGMISQQSLGARFPFLYFTHPLIGKSSIDVVIPFTVIFGTLLILLSRGIQLQSIFARRWTLGTLGLAIVLCSFKGFRYDELIVLLILGALLIASGRFFTRKLPVQKLQFTSRWKTAIVIVMLSLLLIGFLFQGNLWQILPSASALCVTILAFALLGRWGVPLQPPIFAGVDRLKRILHVSPHPLLFFPDFYQAGKSLYLCSSRGKACILFGIQGSHWISFGDPIGPKKEWRNVLWRFLEMCDRYSADPVFFGIDKKSIPFYQDIGLLVQCFGEEGLIRLGSFSLRGKNRRVFRSSLDRMETEKYRFEVVLPEHISKVLAERAHKTDDQGKTGGWQEPPDGAYKNLIIPTMTATVTKNGETVAWAKLLFNVRRKQIIVDRIQIRTGAPDGTLDYLFTKILLWAQVNGYCECNMGIAPAVDIETNPLAPLWRKIGRFIYRHSEYFESLESLREWKERFHPRWRPKYIALSWSFSLPKVINSIIDLIGR